MAPDGADDATRTALYERWAVHILTRTPSPAATEPAEGPAPRDYKGLRRFFVEQRREEAARVDRNLADLRALVWGIVENLGRALGGESEEQQRIQTDLARLREAARTGSTEALKREALAVADSLATTVQERSRRQRNAMATIGARMGALSEALADARKAGSEDALTRLLNRRAFDEALSRTTALVSAFGRESSLLIIDLDNFKGINDAHGHIAGDAVLKAFSDCLVRVFLRKVDVVARCGGEEFAVILADTRQADAEVLARRLLVAVRAMEVPYHDQILKVTASVGVAGALGGESATEWYTRADRALYDAKHAGRDRAACAG
jgi:diguanylate cyclase (GGDEF)-like protein